MNVSRPSPGTFPPSLWPLCIFIASPNPSFSFIYFKIPAGPSWSR